MSDLREKMRAVIAEWDDDGQSYTHSDLADRILALPEIADALRCLEYARKANERRKLMGGDIDAIPSEPQLPPDMR